MAPDGTECFWSIIFSGTETIVTSRLKKGRWTEPEVAPFSGRFFDGWPAFRPDGRRLFFHSARPVPEPGPGESARVNVWYVDRTAAGWSEPRPVGPPVNGTEQACCPSATEDGTLYISKKFGDGTEKICRSAFVNGEYQELEVLPAIVNIRKENFHAFVSPDESYLVMPRSGLKGAIGGGANYYAAFRAADGGWSGLVNLGPGINSVRCGGMASISADGRYIFYQARTQPERSWARDRTYSFGELVRKETLFPTGNTFDIYWIEAGIAGSAKPKGTAAAGAAAPDEKAVIEKVIRDNIGWALTKDRPLAESTMVHDESLFIFNPGSESTIGWSQLVKNFDFWMDPRFKALTCEIWDLRIGVSRSGDAAWWSCMLDDLGEWDGKPTGWKDTRWTGIMEKRDGKWLVVQMHFSFASDKIAAQVKAKLEAGKADPNGK